MSSPSDTVTCARLNERLEAWIDGDLSPSESTVLERHLRSCEACAADERGARAVVDDLRSLRELAPSARVLATVDELSHAPAPPVAPRAVRSYRSWMLAAAALLVAGLSAILATNHSQSPAPADLDRAALEVRYALGVVTRANRAAGRELGDSLSQGLPVDRTASRIGRVLEHTRDHRPVEVDVHGG